MKEVTGVVKAVSVKRNGGLLLMEYEGVWFNGTPESAKLFTPELKSNRVNLLINEANLVTRIEILADKKHMDGLKDLKHYEEITREKLPKPDTQLIISRLSVLRSVAILTEALPDEFSTAKKRDEEYDRLIDKVVNGRVKEE